MFSFKKHFFINLALLVGGVTAHGYVASPRSRNWVANQDGKHWGGDSSDPAPEDCPWCLNRGGTRAACGISQSSGINYDYPPNADGKNGGILPTNIQATFPQGGEIDFEVVLTAHHKGHFSFYACPVKEGEVPKDDCFKEHPLEFVRDLKYGATKDPDHPNRAYIPPTTYGKYEKNSAGHYVHRYTFRLPSDVQGDLVLVQWHYLTANSCTHDGYDSYNFPSDWPNQEYSILSPCTSIPADGSMDGNGVPEQFWNCMELTVTGDSAPTEWCQDGTKDSSGAYCCNQCDGKCGGSGCSKRPGGASQCCKGHIENAGEFCSDASDVACIIPGGGRRDRTLRGV